MHAVLWQVRRFRRYVAWPALLAVVLLIAGFTVYENYVKPLLDERATLEAEMVRVRQIAAEPTTRDTALTPAEQLAAFYAFFPKDDAPSDVLDRIFAAAAKENLSLPQGDYQWAREEAGHLIRYGITLPVKGPYPGVRRFMAQVLKENPSLALDSVNFGRQTVADIGVDAQLHFTLFLRGEIP